MKTYKFFPLAAALFASGCAGFRSGNAPVSRNELGAMLSDKAVRPFADVTVTWKNYPYKSAIDTIGEGTVAGPPKRAAVPVPPEDLDRLRERAKSILAEAGLYSPEKGSGTLELEMTSINRWTYRELWRGFLVDTPFVFIVPSSFRTGYNLAAGFRAPSGAAVKVEETAGRKTVFHLLLAPLYPLFTPGAAESGLIRNMLWKISTDIYGKLKTAQAPPRADRKPAPAAPAAAQEPVPPPQSLPAAVPRQEAAQPVFLPAADD